MIVYDAPLVEDVREQDRLISDNIELVKRIAYHLKARLPAHVEVDDLIQSGMIGLLEAAKNYDSSKGASFPTFAGIRIRGAMLDEVRRHDWTPRSVHQRSRQVSEAIREIEAETGRHAEPEEIAERLKISLDEYHRILRDSAGCHLFSLEEAGNETIQSRQLVGEGEITPDEAVNNDQLREELADGLRRLPERDRMVFSLYYERDLNLKEIGEVLGVSESRVCQIHGQAIARLRASIGK